MSWQEQRREPRTPVEIEARLRLSAKAIRRGLLLNLSRRGALFLAEAPIDVAVGAKGWLRLPLPSILAWLEPQVEIRRATVFDRPDGQPAQGIGIEFRGLRPEEQQAITTCCAKWDAYRGREYRLAARCQVQGEDEWRFFLHGGLLTAGSRTRLKVKLPAESEVPVGALVQVRVADTSVRAVVAGAKPARDSIAVDLALTQDWGRDFFLHEARRSQ